MDFATISRSLYQKLLSFRSLQLCMYETETRIFNRKSQIVNRKS
jgi:hypothetical protein